MSKETIRICGDLHNTLDKLKGVVRKGNPIPSANTVFQWFVKMSPVEIITNRPPVIGLNTKADNFEAIFFFNSMKVYLSLKYSHTDYRGHAYIYFATEIHLIDELDPDEYRDAEVIKYLQNNFNIEIP